MGYSSVQSDMDISLRKHYISLTDQHENLWIMQYV
jgi:hypothetical protein